MELGQAVFGQVVRRGLWSHGQDRDDRAVHRKYSSQQMLLFRLRVTYNDNIYTFETMIVVSKQTIIEVMVVIFEIC